MSEIIGDGYGSSHNWRHLLTSGHRCHEDRGSFYVCDNCDAAFIHFYNIIPNIFDALMDSKVVDICPGKSTAIK